MESLTSTSQLESVAEISNFQCIDMFPSIPTLHFDMFQSIATLSIDMFQSITLRSVTID